MNRPLLRSEAYWFLAALFADPPSPLVLAILDMGAKEAGDTGFAAEIFAAVREEAGSADPVQALAVEHTRLFRGISAE